MTDTAPIPAGALTVDNEPIPDGHTPLLYVIRWADGTGFKVVEADERARLLAGPPRPDGVPDGAVDRQALIDLADRLDQLDREHPDERTIIVDLAAVAEWRDRIRSALAVPTYQPDPDPADSPTGLVATPLTYTPPASGGERTGPLGLSEADTRKIAKQNESWVALAVGSGTLACKAWDAAQGACRAAVAEWDAEPQPAETIDDIVAELREIADDGDTLLPSGVVGIADRIEAASRPDPDTITVNLPASNLADLVRFVERDGRSLNASVLWTLRHFQTALADRPFVCGNAAGEPTEGGQP